MGPQPLPTPIVSMENTTQAASVQVLITELLERHRMRIYALACSGDLVAPACPRRAWPGNWAPTPRMASGFRPSSPVPRLHRPACGRAASSPPPMASNCPRSCRWRRQGVVLGAWFA